MARARSLLLTLALTLGSATALAAPRVAVLPVDFEGRVPEVSRVSLSERLVEGLARAGFEVSAGDVLKNGLVNGPAVETCHAPGCYKQIASKLALDFLVIAQLKIKEKNYALKLQLVSGRDGKPTAEERETCELCGIQEVGEKLDTLASSLMSHVGTPRTEPARLTVQSAPLGASVTVDGRAAGETPVSVELSPGAHEVALQATGHAGTHKKVTLEPGVRGLLSVDLLPLSAPESARSGPPRAVWWGTILVGAGAVAGGVALWKFADHQVVTCPAGRGPPCYRNAKLPVGVLLGAGGVAMATGGLMLFIDWGQDRGASPGAQARQWMVSGSRTF
jgi:hypothetical protein